MIPGEKKLVEELKDEPFALIGINSDPDGRDAFRKKLEKQGMTWRHAMDGSTSGPIATKWNVQGWPTIYVIDADQKIRVRDAHGEEEMVKAVRELLAEMKQK